MELLILAVETSTRAGSVSLSRGEEVLGAALGNAASSHSTDLLDNIGSVLREGNMRLSDIELFAVTVGPGSFTGLRIGLATVKAFAVCFGKPCVPVSTLAAIAHGAGDSEMIEAKAFKLSTRQRTSSRAIWLKDTSKRPRSRSRVRERLSISKVFAREN